MNSRFPRRSPFREALVVPALGKTFDVADCLDVAPAPAAAAAAPAAAAAAPSPADGPADAPAAPVDVAAWRGAWQGATERPLLDYVAGDHPFVSVRASGRGAPPPPFAALAAWAIRALVRDDPATNARAEPYGWTYKRADYPTERYLHVAVKGKPRCRAKGRPHVHQNVLVTVDPLTGAAWQRCFDAADCSEAATNARGGTVRLAKKHALGTAPADARVPYARLHAYEVDREAARLARRRDAARAPPPPDDAPAAGDPDDAPPAPAPGGGDEENRAPADRCFHGRGADCADCEALLSKA